MEILRAMETMSSQQFGFLSLTIIFKYNQYFGNKNYETETEQQIPFTIFQIVTQITKEK